MALTPRLDSVEALVQKLERELVRAFHHRNQTHKADHFYNFCITAHSLKDYFLERIGKADRTSRQRFETVWAANRFLVAVADIANSAKHFQLRDRRTGAPKVAKTRSVKRGAYSGVDIYLDAEGNFHSVKRVGIPTITVTLEDGMKFELYEFMDTVVKYWRAELAKSQIRVRRQSWRSLHGRAT